VSFSSETIWVIEPDDTKHKLDIEIEVLPEKDEGGEDINNGNSSLLLITGVATGIVIAVLVGWFLYMKSWRRRIFP
jgi:hypothetical protein